MLQVDGFKANEINQKTLYVIEPVIESLLQVTNPKLWILIELYNFQTFVQGVILYMVIGPGETLENGEFS